MKVLFDLGSQKSGSKARQLLFANEIDRVLGPGRAVYADAGRQGIWHEPLFASLRKGERDLLDALQAEVDALNSDVELVIVSYECLYQLEPEQIRWLRDCFPDLTACVFLRRQDQLVSSFYNQMHKSHTVSFDDLKKFEAEMLDYNVVWDHRATLQRWTGILEPDAVVPILFDRDRSSVRAFFLAAGIEVDWTGFEERYPNRAIDGKGLGVLRHVKRMTQDRSELWAIVDAAHRRLMPHFIEPDSNAECYTLTLNERRCVLSLYEEANEWVRQNFFPDSNHLFPQLEPGVLVVPCEEGTFELADQIVEGARARRGANP